MDRIKNIKDLAILAGVSAGTVSRALAGSELISERTRVRIKALADEHGFRPNVLARNLRIQRTNAIGVVVPIRQGSNEQISDPFFIAMLGLLADALTERGYDLLLSRVIVSDEHWLNHYVTSGRVDGVVVIGQADQHDAIEAVASHFRPLVVWGGHFEGSGACTVGSDNRAGGALAARHLIERGSRRPGFLGDPQSCEPKLRLEGFRAAIAESGIGAEPMIFEDREALRAALADGGVRPDGLFATSDVLGAQVLVDIVNAGLDVPGDMRVIGYDGLAIGEQVVPRLSTIDQQIALGARRIVDVLLRRIAGEETASIVLEPRLKVRGSS